MKKLAFIFIFFTIGVNAQEHYKWFSIEEIKFYDLKEYNCYALDSVDIFLKKAKSITYKKPNWEIILQNFSTAQKDVIKETSCYVLLVKFKRGESIPFLLHPNQKCLFDMRKGHFNYIRLKENVYKKFDQVLKLSVECINNPNCQEIR